MSISVEDENYMRLCMLVDIGRRAVKVYFDSEIDPKCLKKEINKGYNKFNKLRKKNVISVIQWKILTGKNPNSSEFDIPLMVCILKNLIPDMIISNLLPLSTQEKTTDDIARIVFYRNAIAHINRSCLSDETFLDIWENMCESIKRMPGGLYEECESLQSTGLNLLNKDIKLKIKTAFKELSEFKKVHEKLLNEWKTLKAHKSNPIPPNIRVKFAKQLEKWKEDDKSFKSTNGSNAVLKSIQEQPSVAITGSFGVGKTAILYHVALEMSSKGYIIVPTEGPLDIQKYNHPVEKNLFIVDNFCDECDLDEEEVAAWKNCNVKFDEKCKLLVSCKLQVYRFIKHDKLDDISFHECNLLSNALCLSREERQAIAREKYGIDIADVDEYIELYNCFPLLCQYFMKSNNNVNKRAFFENPFEVFETQFKMLQEVFAYGKVSALMTLLMFDDNVREVMILGDINADDKEILLNTSKACKLNSENVYNTIHRELESLIDTYLLKREGIYHALNERILNFLIRYFGQQMTELLIRHSCRSFFQTRLQLSDPSKDKQDYELSKTVGNSEKKVTYSCSDTWDKVGQNVVVLDSEEYRKLYVNRMFTDWSKGYVKDALNNPNLYHVFSFKYLEKKDKDELKQLTEITDLTDGSTSLIAYCNNRTYTYSAFENMYDIAFHWLTGIGCSVNTANAKGETALFLAVVNGTVDMLQVLINNGADSDICTNEGCSPLYKACEKDNNEVVKNLLTSGADCNKCTTNGESPLHAACSGGSISIVNDLLKYNADVSIRNKDGRTPLDVARLKNHQDIIHEILRHNESCDS